jgi:hypothetical protein
MPKLLFEGESDSQILENILNSINAALVGSSKAKTVEELQVIINNVNRVIIEVKKTIKNL